MTKMRIVRAVQAIAGGALILQVGGCDVAGFYEFAQTVFLGITAAGSIAIIQNI
jgi:hypothetical protein